jgi:putative endonuclease
MFATYIMSNKRQTVLYTGMTNNLARRVFEHKSHAIKGFTQKYNCDDLLYYEIFETPAEAIVREKQIKGILRYDDSTGSQNAPRRLSGSIRCGVMP